MATLLRKLKSALSKTFPAPAKIKLKEDDGILGMVVSDQFEGLEPIDRLNLIWKVIDQNLSPEEKREIVIVMAVTPEEELVHSSN